MVNRRFGQIGRLKKEKIDEYVKLHADVWPDVKKMIMECNLQNYSIFIRDDLVFSYFEYTGENYDAEKDGRRRDDAEMVGIYKAML